GMMNIGIPSNVVKVLRQKFEQQWGTRKNAITDDESERILELIKPAGMRLEARLPGSTVTVEDLIRLKQGDILQFTRSINDPVQLLVNGMPKFRGQIVENGRRKALAVQGLAETRGD
ncbi:MAG: FliM/FliN family flagellar motor switch protein, partial [Bryobacteraceae bacterium]